MDKLSVVQLIIVWAIPILFAVTMHEAAHGWVANRLGDDTASRAGRVTLNPFKHIDWVGTIILPLVLLVTAGVVFGWAKPVPINGNRLNHPRRDMALVALAGPLSNFMMALIWTALLKYAVYLLAHHNQIGVPLLLMCQAGINVNLVLMILNLIPIPPLDGSRVVSSALPPKAAELYNRIEYIGFLILIVLLITNILPKILIPPVEWMYRFLIMIFH